MTITHRIPNKCAGFLSRVHPYIATMYVKQVLTTDIFVRHLCQSRSNESRFALVNPHECDTVEVWCTHVKPVLRFTPARKALTIRASIPRCMSVPNMTSGVEWLFNASTRLRQGRVYMKDRKQVLAASSRRRSFGSLKRTVFSHGSLSLGLLPPSSTFQPHSTLTILAPYLKITPTCFLTSRCRMRGFLSCSLPKAAT